VFDFVFANFLDGSPTKFNFNVRSPTSRFSNGPAGNDPSPQELHCFHLSFTIHFFVRFLFVHLRGSRHCPHAVSFFIRHLVPPRDRRCWSLEFSLIAVEVVVVLSRKPELLSYPPSGDVGLPSWLIAFRTLQSDHHCLRSVNPIVLTSILTTSDHFSPFRQILIRL
jgi:hypothetical protein